MWRIGRGSIRHLVFHRHSHCPYFLNVQGIRLETSYTRATLCAIHDADATMRHKPRKRLGQNFLRDKRIINDIEKAIDPRISDHLVEIGPGQGALTESLVRYGCQMDAIELDRDLTHYLQLKFNNCAHFTLHNADALNFDFSSLVKENTLRIVGNLPYNISTPLILRCLDQIKLIKDMHFMLQYEVVRRLAAQPGSKLWGRLGVISQFHCDVEHLLDISPQAFFPIPKVNSALIRLTPKKQPANEVDPKCLSKTVALCFGHRRKTLRNNLKGIFSEADLKGLNIDPSARPETLPLGDFIALTKSIRSDNN